MSKNDRNGDSYHSLGDIEGNIHTSGAAGLPVGTCLEGRNTCSYDDQVPVAVVRAWVVVALTG